MGNKIKFDCMFSVCDKVIGTDTAAIADSQISASSEANIASNVKRSSATGWRPNKRGKPFCENEFVEVRVKTIYGSPVLYLLIVNDSAISYKYFLTVYFCFDFQIDFINRIKIMALSVLSAGDDNTDYVTNFTVQYSNDGVFWTDLTDNTTNVKVFNV